MGEVGNFLFGGSSSKQGGSNSYESTSNSQNQSQQQSQQGSFNTSSNQQTSGGQSYNQAYGGLAEALGPSLGYVSSASNMIASLLGLPTSTYSMPAPTALPALLPPAPATSSSTDLTPLIDLYNQMMEDQEDDAPPPTAPPPSSTPPPSTTPPPSSTPPPSTTPPPSSGPPAFDPNQADAIQTEAALINSSRNMTGIPAQGISFLAAGGPVQPGQPVVVGETQPELFVPQTPGVVLPSAGGRGRRNQDWRSMVMQRLASRMGGAPLPGTPANPNPTTPVTVPVPGTTTAPTVPATAPTVTSTAAPAATSTAAPSASSGLENWADSAGMNFILDQGQQAISGASAANGVFNSGATGKALVEYGQNLGKTYLNDYMNNLFGLAKVGLGSASALGSAGGVSVNQSSGGGGSSGLSFGNSSGSSSGSSSSTSSGGGTTSGKSNAKKGLLS